MITKEQYKHSDLTGKIIGCAMEVHKLLGNGFQEVIYQRALLIAAALETSIKSTDETIAKSCKELNISTPF